MELQLDKDEIVIHKDKDIKSAVEWLKIRLSDEQDRRLVDEAFEDITKGR